MAPARSRLGKARRVVVKVGSRALARDAGFPDRLAREIAAARAAARGDARAFVVVSSGAIALGCERLGYRKRPSDMGALQAAAAAGQSALMRRWDEAFGAVGLTSAQVLLTHADLADRERLNNARDALGALLEAGAVPVVNENDTVATDEIRFGDNDQLASMVAPLVAAELLVLLTDVEGVLDPRGDRIPIFDERSEVGKVVTAGAVVGRGGMESKLDAARKAARAGATAVIAPAGRDGVLGAVLAGADVGTLFPPVGEVLRARKHWIAYTLRPRGTVLVDEGAARALASGKSSLLPIGVLGVRGEFGPGDGVLVVGPDGAEVGRGLARLGALDVARAAGKKGSALELVLGRSADDVVVVHRDDLVLGA
ncbi:MAG: glutamate 5-kinase [Polyangiaceae bacterium]|nr:glutamate 5-kinase [Polyangiaceae bacterium]